MIITTETTDQQLTNRSRRRLARLAAAALATAAVLAIAGFTALGSIFSYPQILHEPVEVVLNRFRDHQAAVMGWFAVLTLSAALMAPAGSWLGRLRGGTLGRWITGLGIAAAVVQVAGLQRWITIVPGISEQALDPGSQAALRHRLLRPPSESAFLFWHRLLGTAIGETVGYALTAAFTVLVVIAFDRRLLPRWLVVLGGVAATLIATGVIIPVVSGASLTNFAGYVLWCVWLLVVAGFLIKAARSDSVCRT